MNLQERLLVNEVKHLGRIIQTLSYELVVLQEYIREEHGSKFERFRANYESKSGQSGPSKRVVTPATQNKRNQSQEAAQFSKDTEDEPDPNRQGDETGENRNEDDYTSEVYEGDLTDMDDSDSDTSLNLKDPVFEPDERKGGRRKTKVWQYFDKITNSSGGFSARCHICRCLVSSRAARMVDHRLKCKLNSDRRITPKKRPLKTEDLEFLEDPPEDDDSRDFSGVASKKEKQSDPSSRPKPTGRSQDIIWKYFVTVYQNELKKAQCKACGQNVSPKAIRMRQHKISCLGKPASQTDGKEGHTDGANT